MELKYTMDGYNKFLDPDGYPAVTPPWGTLSAINLDTGEYVWKELSANIPNSRRRESKRPARRITVAGSSRRVGCSS